MAVKLAVFVLAALTVVAVSAEKEKRQSGSPFSEYFNKFQEQMKPITSQFGPFPNFGSFPSLPGVGGSGASEGNSPSKRQINPNTVSEWFSQFQESGNFPGNLPFNPQQFGQFGQFGQFPFPGSSSGSNEVSENESS